MMFISYAYKKLQQSNNKITKTRKEILDYFANSEKARSAYDIQKYIHTIDIVTIYRNLELLESLGLIHKVRSLGAYIKCESLFSCKETNQCTHEFQVCKECHTCEEIHTHHNHHISGGFQLQGHISEYFGICKECLARQ